MSCRVTLAFLKSADRGKELGSILVRIERVLYK